MLGFSKVTGDSQLAAEKRAMTALDSCLGGFCVLGGPLSLRSMRVKPRIEDLVRGNSAGFDSHGPRAQDQDGFAWSSRSKEGYPEITDWCLEKMRRWLRY